MARALVLCCGHVIAAAAIRGWLDAGNEIAELWIDRGQGLRRSQRTANNWAPDWSVWRLAQRHGLDVFSPPERYRHWPGYAARIGDIGADTLISAMTMQIVPAAMLALFPGRAVNFHPALLPHYRGPSPFLGLLLDGRENADAGVTLHELSAGIDEGPIIASESVPFDAAGRNYGRWQAQHAGATYRLARQALPAFLAGTLRSRPQSGGSYRKVREEARIDAAASADDASRAAARIGATGRLSFAGVSGVRIGGFIADTGPARGRLPVITPLSVTAEIGDRRLKFRRWTALDDGLFRLAMVRELRRIRAQE